MAIKGSLHTHIQKLTTTITKDLKQMVTSLVTLQDQVDSLAEVVLQNRRGLDLLTAEKGGLCVFLKEECCFYNNKSGVVRNIAQELEERFKKRLEEQGTNSFFSFFGRLPWLLLLIGPLLTVFLILLVAPCLARCLTDFLQGRIPALTSQTFSQMFLGGYQPLKSQIYPQAP